MFTRCTSYPTEKKISESSVRNAEWTTIIFLQWQRKQLWNEKLGKSSEVMEPVMSAVTITGRPEELKKPEAKQINVTNAPISFILIKLSDGMSLRKYNTNPEEVSSLLSKLIV